MLIRVSVANNLGSVEKNATDSRIKDLINQYVCAFVNH